MLWLHWASEGILAHVDVESNLARRSGFVMVAAGGVALLLASFTVGGFVSQSAMTLKMWH